MTQHLVAWQESADQAALAAINAVQDDILTRSGTERFVIPDGMNYIHWGYAAGPDLTRALLFAPSLGVRRMNAEIIPQNRAGEVLTLTQPQIWKPSVPIQLVPSEEIEAQTSEDNAAASQMDVFCALGPAEMPPIPSGDIRVNRCLGTTTVTARAWSSVLITPDQSFEPGDYALIGLIANSATVVMARALFQGQAWRPGVPGIAGAEADAKDFDPAVLWPFGGYDMGRFTHREIPQIQFFCTAADAAERVYLVSVKL